MANALGECWKCKGPLCMRGPEVRCAKPGCGLPQPDHQVTKDLEAKRAADLASPPPPIVNTPCSPIEYRPDHVERITLLERQVRELRQEIAELKRLLGKQPARKSA
jgi:hypothetical protein